ncbi:site-2 protease family protein [Vibrio diazotrophicus]|uniref:site-2 protease family protein n=1 Tax=Vibrio diazotrophicus TaxID=685 RepID=UPI0015E080CE|nr:site-2 protease family protein [Vibrio diazotrophicus]
MWSLHDPVRNLYFRIDWPTFEMLCRWHLGESSKVLEAVCLDTTLNIDDTEIQQLVQFLVQSELVRTVSSQETKWLTAISHKRKQGWLMWSLHHYLFFRIPLWKPNKFLTRTVGWFSWTNSRWFITATLIALLTGIIQSIRQWDTFSSTLVDMFSLDGLFAYGITIIGIKILHEFGHAYTAKSFGCRVPTMGIAFLVMFPMAYTDVNDVWQLRKKSQRLWVGAAGIITELVIAAWSTLLWALLPDGSLRTAVFLLATTTWISTLVVNASPFLRFDGYFLLMDALEMPNLHARAFAIARWDLRERLFKLGDPIPQIGRKNLHTLLILFAWGVWFYRLIVFSGIAVLVYYTFPKPLGPLLGWIEIYWFILKPIMGELKIWWQRKQDMMKHYRSYITFAVVILLMAVMFIPLDPRVNLVALLKPGNQITIALSSPAQLNQLYVHSGQQTASGMQLAKFTNPDMSYERANIEKRIEQVEWSLQAGIVSKRDLNNRQILIADRERLESEHDGIINKEQALLVTAPISGVLQWFDIDLQPGDWVDANRPLGQIVSQDEFQIMAYVDQQDLTRIRSGDEGLFISDSGAMVPFSVRVKDIAVNATRVLGDDILSSVRGGKIVSRSSGNQIIPENAIYQIKLVPIDPDFLLVTSVLTGQVVIKGKPQAWITPYWKSALATVRREAGF